MENANKALMMAASTIIAVMLFAVFVLFIKNISVWPEEQGDLLSTEQRAKFNEEYQVYQKSMMYGVDVISCLNKAYSNNVKYDDAGAYKADEDKLYGYYINVKVKMKNTLTESIEVRAIKDVGETQILNDTSQIKDDDGTALTFEKAGFKINENMLTKWDKDTVLCYNMTATPDDTNTLKGGTTYALLHENDNNRVPLERLLKLSNHEKQIVKNTTLDDDNKKHANNGWTVITWNTVLNDFKKRRFTCKDMEYNEHTGLVNLIVFEEI